MHGGRHDVVQFRIAADKDLEAAARESRLLCSTDLWHNMGKYRLLRTANYDLDTYQSFPRLCSNGL